jgi:hypothetical protein
VEKRSLTSVLFSFSLASLLLSAPLPQFFFFCYCDYLALQLLAITLMFLVFRANVAKAPEKLGSERSENPSEKKPLINQNSGWYSQGTHPLPQGKY